MRNLCEMYAKCMRKCMGVVSRVSFLSFGVFLRSLCFIGLGYAKYAKPFFVFMLGLCLTSLWFRIFAYISYLCSNVLFLDLEGGECSVYAKILNFAYFRILRIN